MNITKIAFLLILSATFLLSCGDDLKKQRQEIYDEVMVVHDEMMMMSKIRKAKIDLKEKITLAETEKDSATAATYQTALQQLETADKAMMDWMKQFKNPPAASPDKEAIEYLKIQKEKVLEMKKVMVENMDEVRKVIEF